MKLWTLINSRVQTSNMALFLQILFPKYSKKAFCFQSEKFFSLQVTMLFDRFETVDFKHGNNFVKVPA